MKKRTFSLLIAAILSAAVLAGCNQPIENPEFTSAPNGEQVITEDTAKRAAMEHLSFSLDEVQFTRAELDTDDGKNQYDVEFVHDGYEYEIEVNAEDGSIKNVEKEKVDEPAPDKDQSDTSVAPENEPESKPEANSQPESKPETNSQPESTEPEYIGEDKALLKTLKKAELADVNRADLIDLEIEFEIDDGRPEYEIDFEYGGYDYDVTVSATDGEITKFERDKDDDNKISAPPATDVNDNSGVGEDKPVDTTPDFITEKEAKAIAFADAGVKEAEVIMVHLELDKDDYDNDGVKYEYEIEFICGYDEYDYDINALDGKIVDVDKESEFGSAPSVPNESVDELIAEAEAKAIAFADAGVNEADVYALETELGEDDGVAKYEIEFKCGNIEYKYDIAAKDGRILDREKDIDD